MRATKSLTNIGLASHTNSYASMSTLPTFSDHEVGYYTVWSEFARYTLA